MVHRDLKVSAPRKQYRYLKLNITPARLQSLQKRATCCLSCPCQASTHSLPLSQHIGAQRAQRAGAHAVHQPPGGHNRHPYLRRPPIPLGLLQRLAPCCTLRPFRRCRCRPAARASSPAAARLRWAARLWLLAQNKCGDGAASCCSVSTGGRAGHARQRAGPCCAQQLRHLSLAAPVACTSRKGRGWSEAARG